MQVVVFLNRLHLLTRKKLQVFFPIFEEAGYTVARGYNDYKAKTAKSRKDDPDSGRRC